MPFCYSPWTNLDINPAGEIAPCCKFEWPEYGVETPNIITTDIQQYKDSPILDQVKKELMNNEWPAGCKRCKIEEDNGVGSKRTLDYDRWKNHYEQYDLESDKFITASVAFGNTCNYKCITCTPSASSRWHKEYIEIYGRDIKPHHFYKKGFVEELLLQCPSLVHLTVPGGEPMISGVSEQKEMLDYYIDTDQAKNITLHYITNASIFPESDWWDKWKEFKSVEIQLSIDGVGKRNEYIRFLSDWKTVDTHVDQYVAKSKQLNNLKLAISHTLSSYSVYYLDEFFYWCAEKRLPKPWIGRVHTPEHMRYTVFPEPIRKQIAEHLRKSRFPTIHVWADSIANNDDSEYFERFLEKTHAHDEYRGNSFHETFPELAELIANYQQQL